jgi:L-alanine-DL-glutamate epimerase-like enolase superfamily enzyme
MFRDLSFDGLEMEVVKRPLIFKRPAKTSRDVMTEKPCYYLKATDKTGKTVLGECSLIPGLSLESEDDVVKELNRIATGSSLRMRDVSREMPSVRFAVEMVLIEFCSARLVSEFSNGRKGLEINGLVWMDSMKSMLGQVDSLVERGFKTIKLKVGALPFEEELKLLREVRRRCPVGEYTLRVDANGAFHKDTLESLNALGEFQLHSIEQPIPAGNACTMSEICSLSSVPIALDEELIGVFSKEEKISLLKGISPDFIVLKPSLIGGLSESTEWIEVANDLSIGWWVTSALESNLGLTAIADWTGWIVEKFEAEDVTVSGLGTGSLYTNNSDSDLEIIDGELWQKDGGELIIDNRKWRLDAGGARRFYDDKLRHPWTNGLASFLIKWFESANQIESMTSGSTGKPKVIKHSRVAIIASANDTLQFFNLENRSKLILALPIEFIAGKMMVIRAITGNHDLIAVNSNLEKLWDIEADFVALTPHQLSKITKNRTLASFPSVKTILLGGSPASDRLLSLIPSHINVYEGYGMTETITHVALRKRVHENTPPPYKALAGVSFEKTSDNRLVISARNRNVKSLITDDIIELHDAQSFSWISRASNIINSGGIKFIPEEIERKLRTVINHELVIYGAEDGELGERIVLHIECSEQDEEQLDEKIRTVLDGKEVPREIRWGNIDRNKSGKIIRQ